MKSRIKRTLLILLAVLWVSPVAYAGTLQIGVGGNPPGNTEILETVVSFNTGGDTLGAFELVLYYNPAEITVLGVEPGDSPYFANLNSKIDNEKGLVRLSAFQGSSMEEPSGTIVICRVGIKAKNGEAGQRVFKEFEAEFLSAQGSLIPIDQVLINAN